MTPQASESRDLDQALRELPAAEAFVQRLLARFRPFMQLAPGASVLDLGAAQGITTTAWAKMGFVARGVEPWAPAIEVSRQLAERTGVPIDVRSGSGEAIPFEDETFDYVHAYSVMEHVDDPIAVFREVHRVLRPGGGFFFATTSRLTPRQAEIARFPLFPWYPPPAQRAIMHWAVRERPWLVGYTTRPAMHWFQHRATRRDLLEVGFRRTADKWEFRAESGELTGSRQRFVRAAANNSLVRVAGNLVVGGVEYLAVK